jgi:two-component system sensor histidine kinase PilS (NtrC family)
MPDPEKPAPWPEMIAILLARLAGLWLLILVSFLLPKDDAVFYALMGIAFIITIPYSLWLRGRLRSKQFAPRQFIIDLVLVTGLVYFTGGVQSHFFLLYPLVILSVGIVGTPKQAARLTALTLLVYALMAAILSSRLIRESVPAATVFEMDSLWGSILIRSLIFASFGAAGIYIAKRCSFIHTHEQVLLETTSMLLGSIPVPMLLLNTEGLIVFANDSACAALNTTDQSLCTKKFRDLCQKDGTPIPESFGRSAYLMCEAQTPLPVSYTTRDMQIREAALPGASGRKNRNITTTLLLFTDITDVLKTSGQLQKVEHITSATRIAGEMAHEIQAPLATLSASVQLLHHYEDKATAADWLPNSPRRNDRRELFEHIEDASARMDRVIRNFIDFAEFSPQDLLSIIKLDSIGENQGYIDHLNIRGRNLKDGQNTHSG